MNKRKILTVVGARPQFVKAATVSRAIRSQASSSLEEYLVHTGQHYDYKMSDIFFEELSIPKPDVNLHVGSGQHGSQTGEMLRLIEKEIVEMKPDLLLVYGDTNSTLAGALAAAKLHIPVAHVESGLRSFNKKMPEEVNRILTDHVSSLLFAPTTTAINNLKKEGIAGDHVQFVGDVMFDAIRFYRSQSSKYQPLLKELDVEPGNFIFATIHRAENTNDAERLGAIFDQLGDIAKRIPIVLPLHPRTTSYLEKINLKPSSNIKIIEPTGYLATLMLQQACRLIITDSGGVQKEAFMNEKFCITVRPETEWIELVDHGYNFLAEPVNELQSLVEQVLDKRFTKVPDFEPYGSGDAANKIVSSLLQFLR